MTTPTTRPHSIPQADLRSAAASALQRAAFELTTGTTDYRLALSHAESAVQMLCLIVNTQGAHHGR